MERSSTFSTAEVVAVATAAAGAVGGILVGLSRAQANAARERLLAAQARDRFALAGLDIPVDRVRRAASSLADSYPDLRSSASELTSRLTETTRPAIEQLSEAAASQLSSAKAGGATVRDRLQETVTPAAVEALGSLRQRVEEVADRSQQVGPAVAATTAEKADIAVSRTTGVAKETMATLGWLSAAFALIYFVVLTPERREQVIAFLAAAFEQVQLLVQDFQGYEDEL